MFSFVGRIKNVLEYSAQKYLKFRLQSVSFFAAKTSEDDRYMIVDVNRNNNSSKCEKLKYPLIWLRDNCQCSNCFHSQSKSRTIDWTKFDFKDAQPKSISVSNICLKLNNIKLSQFSHSNLDWQAIASYLERRSCICIRFWLVTWAKLHSWKSKKIFR